MNSILKFAAGGVGVEIDLRSFTTEQVEQLSQALQEYIAQIPVIQPDVAITPPPNCT